MRILIDREVCVGSGNCVYFEPKVFGQDPDDGLVTLVTDSPEPDIHKSALAAVENCPVRALFVAK
jgi:ferredoxin